MKYCAECSTDYPDNVDICVKDGHALVSRKSGDNRLCSHCANSVPADALVCPHCHSNLPAQSAFAWAREDEPAAPTTVAADFKRMPKSTKLLWIAGVLLSAILGFFVGGQLQRNDLLQSMQDQLKEVHVKEQKIKVLETQFAQIQQDAAVNSRQLAELKTQLDEHQTQLAAAQQKLTGAMRETPRLAAASVTPAPRAVARPSETLPPPRVATRPADPVPPLSTSAPARPSAEPGAYETVRPTTVHEEPVNSSRVVSQIEKGTRINVVRSSGDWLEVRSKLGNPPGFIRRDDAMLVSRAN